MSVDSLSVEQAFHELLTLWGNSYSSHFAQSINTRFVDDMQKAQTAHETRDATQLNEIIEHWYLWVVEQSSSSDIDESPLAYFDLEEAFLRLKTAMHEEDNAKIA